MKFLIQLVLIQCFQGQRWPLFSRRNCDCNCSRTTFFFFTVTLCTTSSYSHKSCETPLSSESSSSLSVASRNLPPSPSGPIVKEEPCEMATVLIETHMIEEDEETEGSTVTHQDGNPLGKKCNDFLPHASSDFFFLSFLFLIHSSTIFTLSVLRVSKGWNSSNKNDFCLLLSTLLWNPWKMESLSYE